MEQRGWQSTYTYTPPRGIFHPVRTLEDCDCIPEGLHGQVVGAGLFMDLANRILRLERRLNAAANP